jgi:hypothetical protein
MALVVVARGGAGVLGGAITPGERRGAHAGERGNHLEEGLEGTPIRCSFSGDFCGHKSVRLDYPLAIAG